MTNEIETKNDYTMDDRTIEIVVFSRGGFDYVILRLHLRLGKSVVFQYSNDNYTDGKSVSVWLLTDSSIWNSALKNFGHHAKKLIIGNATYSKLVSQIIYFFNLLIKENLHLKQKRGDGWFLSIMFDERKETFFQNHLFKRVNVLSDFLIKLYNGIDYF